MLRVWFRQAGVAAGLSLMVAAGLVVGAEHWQPPSTSVSDSKAVPASDRRPELRPPPGPANEQDGGLVPERDPKRFYRKPPRQRKPRTEMFAGPALQAPQA